VKRSKNELSKANYSRTQTLVIKEKRTENIKIVKKTKSSILHILNGVTKNKIGKKDFNKLDTAEK